MNLLLKRCLPAILLVIFATGCRSTNSFFMRRFDSDQLAGSSNGKLGIHDNAKPFKGVPITLKVPTHVDITIQETIFLDYNTLDPIVTERRNLKAAAATVYSDKLFSVDPKRAAAGQTEYTFDMNNEHEDVMQRQYFKSISQKITDQTIQDVTAALNSILPLLAPKTAPGASFADAPTVSGGLLSVDRDVAWKRFDIDSPDFEEQVRAFVDEQMNSCHSCCLTGTELAGTHIQTVHQ
jgi:hypothetical protein